jgi:hypothetical protein
MPDTTEPNMAKAAAAAAVVNGPEDDPLDWDAVSWRRAEGKVPNDPQMWS